MRLDGKLVWIRELTKADARALHDLRVRNRAFFTPYEPVMTDADFTLGAVARSIERGLEETARDESYSFGIFRHGDDTLVGRIRLTSVFRGPWQNCNAGYYIDESNCGRGYATEALMLATTLAFSELALHRTQAGAITDNARSIRVLEKAGFRYEGTAPSYLKINGAWRDHAIYAVTAEEWPPASPR